LDARTFLNNILTVDTGEATGWAYWYGTKFPETGEIKCPSKLLKDHFLMRNYMTDAFNILLYEISKHKSLSIVYLEGTQAYNSSISIAAIKKGSLFELSYLVGRYEQVCADNGLDCEIKNAPEWKGQMTKEATAAKIKILNGMTYPSVHITDAVGFGFGIMKMLQWEKRK